MSTRWTVPSGIVLPVAYVIVSPVAYANLVDGAKRQSSSNPKYLYHYTDDDGLSSIAISGYIKALALQGPVNSTVSCCACTAT
jgi:hypothetical protein